MKNPYEILDLMPEADDAIVQTRYEELKSRYSEDRFLPGEEGNTAARKLTELENAYAQIQSDHQRKQEPKSSATDEDAQNASQNTSQNTNSSSNSSSFDFSYIDELIKKGEYDQAQQLLDGVSNRVGEWHYLQSIIYYKREWLSDSRKQLVMALELEPRNEKFRNALDRLDLVMGNPNADARTIGVDPNAAGQQQAPGEGQMCGGNCLSNCCLAYCLTDCCCSMTRCC